MKRKTNIQMKFSLKSLGKLSVMFFFPLLFYPICTVIWPKNPEIDKDKIFIELLLKTLYDPSKMENSNFKTPVGSIFHLSI